MLGSPYQGYLYAYPHKTAYRPLSPRPRLADVWAAEPTDALFLYVHLPFCEMRCGFCNLFTRARPPAEQVTAYLRQLGIQAERVGAALAATGPQPDAAPVRFARAAIGGGTPTFLTADELTTLFDTVERTMDVKLRDIPLSVETSPATATPDRLEVLLARGATRISIGVQSFLDVEAHRAGRPQHRAEVDRALDTIRTAGPVDLNIDLIYGIPGQTAQTWEQSLRAALQWRPEELYLYPLYVRPLTGLGRNRGSDADPEWDAQRLTLYRQARDLLHAEGYQQESMRAFRRQDAPHPTTEAPAPSSQAVAGPTGQTPAPGSQAVARPTGQTPTPSSQAAASQAAASQAAASPTAASPTAASPTAASPTTQTPDYCCQDDGMVGLGCGARSYTRTLHYSFDYAVSIPQVRTILEDYLTRPAPDFDLAEVGFTLDATEQRRRWLLKSLLRTEGLSRPAYHARFGTDVTEDFPQLSDSGHLIIDRDNVTLTDEGLAHSDAIGPWLISTEVRTAMTANPVR